MHHDDAKREWAYDRDSHVGRLNKALDAAGPAGWIVVSMKDTSPSGQPLRLRVAPEAGFRLTCMRTQHHRDFEWDVTMHGPVIGTAVRF